MALIGTIRKNSWILIVMIAVGMGGFILQSIVQGGSKYAAGDRNTIGEVNGEKIDYREFSETERILYGNSASGNVYSNKATLWNYFKNKTLSNTLAEDLGLDVSTEELLELEFGDNLSPIISSRFKNKQTGLVDRDNLNQIQQMIDEDKLNPEYKSFWAVQEKEIIYDRLKTKMSNMVSKAIFTPSWYAEDSYKLEQAKADFSYVKIPFDKISDDDVDVSDAAIQAFIDKNKNKYTNKEEKRVLKYIVMEVKPSANDVKVIKEKANALATDFKTSENDSLFTITNEGIYTNVYYKSEDLPEQVKGDSTTKLNVGMVFGPYEDKGIFTIAKILDKKVIPDSVKARHILISVPQEGATPEAFAQAKNKIDSIKTLLEKGVQTFDSLAIKLSQDPGSAAKGGDLGTFAQGRMVPAFNEACFHGKKGDYKVVTTRFGVHLIEIENQIYNDRIPKYKVAYVTLPIVPSQETQDSIYDLGGELLISSTTPELLEENAKKYNLEVKKSMPLKANDFTFMDLGSDQTSRDIIRWAFEEGTEKGNIAPTVYMYSNKKLYYNEKYVLAILDNIFPIGVKSVEEVRNDVESLVKNELKGKMISEKITSENLDDVAKQFDLTTQTASQIAFSSKFVDKIGNEPKVISDVFNGETGKSYGPIIGNSGVFIVSPQLVQESTTAVNVVAQRKTMNDKIKNTIPSRLFTILAEKVKIEDNRKRFY